MKARLIPFCLETFITLIIILIFCAATVYSAASILLQTSQLPDAESPVPLLFAVAVMGLSGLGLITLLGFKIRSLETSNRQKQHIMALFEARVAAIEAAGDGIGIVDGEGNLAYMNAALKKLHGISTEEETGYIGKPWEALYNEKGKAAIRTNVLPQIESKGSWKGETPLVRKDGKIVFTEMSLQRLPGGGFIGTARDVTEKKKAREENEQLQKQFYHAQRLEAVGRLAGGIAHDFNNLLSSILGYGEFLVDDLDPRSRQGHFARQIIGAGMQARHLVDQILTFSRRNESPKEVINLSEAIEQTAEMIKVTLPSIIELELELERSKALIYANPTQIGQMLMNLCVNAADAMGESAGRMSIRLSYFGNSKPEVFRAMETADSLPDENYALEAVLEDKAGEQGIILRLGKLVRNQDYFAVTISDTGCGMSREILEHAFEPFFTTKGLEQGTGLGLSTVLGMMAAHQGALLVDSRPGRGSDFTLLFPAANGAEDIIFPAGKEEYVPHAGGRLLIVEDQEAVREVMGEIVSRLGYEFGSVGNGFDAIDLLREKPGRYDLVISDFIMPHMSGIEMAEEIHHDFPGLPVIILSGFSDDISMADFSACPSIKAVLSKPVDSKILGREIRAIYSNFDLKAAADA